MKRLLLFLLLSTLALGQVTKYHDATLEGKNTFTNTNVFLLGMAAGPTTVAALPVSAPSGTIMVTSDGLGGTTPCVGGSNGAIAIFLNGVWNCALSGSGGGGSAGLFSVPPAIPTMVVGLDPYGVCAYPAEFLNSQQVQICNPGNGQLWINNGTGNFQLFSVRIPNGMPPNGAIPTYVATNGDFEFTIPTSNSSSAAIGGTSIFSGPNGQGLATSEGEVHVSSYMAPVLAGSTNDECQAILAAWQAACTSNQSCNIIDDMGGVQACSVNPIPTGARRGELKLVGNGNQHSLYLQQQWQIPSAVHITGLGNSGTTVSTTLNDTIFKACNSVLYNSTLCPSNFTAATTGNGAYSSAVSSTTYNAGANTITIVTSVSMDITTTDVNHVDQYRFLCISGSATANNNACWMVNSVTNGTTFVVSGNSSVTNCAASCGTVFLDIPMVTLGTGGGQPNCYFAHFSNITLDGSYLPYVGGWVNGQCEEDSWVQSTQVYNTPVYYGRVEGSQAYGGGGGFGSNSGPYGPNEGNFAVVDCTKNGGCTCVNGLNSTSGIQCTGGLAAQGALMACTTAASLITNGAAISPDPCQQNFVGFLFHQVAQTTLAQNTVRPWLGETASISDKLNSTGGQAIPEMGGGTCTNCAIGVLYSGWGITDTGGHVEFFDNCRVVGAQAAVNPMFATALVADVNYGIEVLGASDSPCSQHYGVIGAATTIAPADIEFKHIGVNPSTHAFTDFVTNHSCATGGNNNTEYSYELGTGTNPWIHTGGPACSNLLQLYAPSYSLSGGNLLVSTTAPTINAGFNTSGFAITTNGTASIKVTVGTGTGTSTGTLTMPTATTGWNCTAQNQSRADVIQQTGNTTTSVTFTNFGTGFAATNFTNGDTILIQCGAF